MSRWMQLDPDVGGVRFVALELGAPLAGIVGIVGQIGIPAPWIALCDLDHLGIAAYHIGQGRVAAGDDELNAAALHGGDHLLGIVVGHIDAAKVSIVGVQVDDRATRATARLQVFPGDRGIDHSCTSSSRRRRLSPAMARRAAMSISVCATIILGPPIGVIGKLLP